MRWSLLVTLAMAAGCGLPEAKIARPDAEAPQPLHVVHISAPRVKREDPASIRRLEEAIGVASSVAGLDAVILGGDVIANDSPDTAGEALDIFGSLAGILAAKRYVVLGQREREGSLGRAELVRDLEQRGLVQGRAGSYGAAVREGIRFIALDVGTGGQVAPEMRRVLEEELKGAKETTIFVASDAPPLDPATQDLLRKDRRVKLTMHRAVKGSVSDHPGEPISVATPPLDAAAQPAIMSIEIDGPACKVRLMAVPSGTTLAEWTAQAR